MTLDEIKELSELRLQSEQKLHAEIARLRAALEQIVMSDTVSDEAEALIEIARKALANEQSPISVPPDTDPAVAPRAE